MPQVTDYALRQQYSRLNSAYSFLQRSWDCLRMYQEELRREYQSLETTQLILACDRYMETIQRLMKRCEYISLQLQWLEKSSL